ncbi:MAG: helix-hairpin-helix domain-containing protein [Limnochordia bacterium]|nr:helix-hairpin-helix domain-containing protein [Limnochordia bacterium]
MQSLKRLLMVCLLVLCITTMPLLALEVHFVNVGQGDAIVIMTDTGAVMLIDGGETPGGKNVLVPYLRQLDITGIDLLVATHPHYDHVGGLIPVLEEFEVGEVAACGQIHTSSTYISFLELIDRLNIPFQTPRQGDRLDLAGVDELLVLSPPEESMFDDLNENSLVLYLRYGDVSFLFTGDAGHGAELDMIGKDMPVKATVLKVGHHGSRYSSHGDFLASVLPDIAVIQSGAGNSYGHPHQETLQRLAALQVRIYRNDESGHIVVRTDGQSYQVLAEQDLARSLININTAPKEQLMLLPGIGPTLADRIMEHRQGQPFTSKEELTKIKGIGQKTYEKLENLITTGGD